MNQKTSTSPNPKDPQTQYPEIEEKKSEEFVIEEDINDIQEIEQIEPNEESEIINPPKENFDEQREQIENDRK